MAQRKYLKGEGFPIGETFDPTNPTDVEGFPYNTLVTYLEPKDGFIKTNTLDTSTLVSTNNKPVLLDYTITPTPSNSSGTNVLTINQGITVQVYLKASDVDGDAVSFKIDWGDGTIVNRNNGSYEVTESHTYTAAGTKYLVVTLTDERGADRVVGLANVVVNSNVNTPPSIISFSTTPAYYDDPTFGHTIVAATGQLVTYNIAYTDPDLSITSVEYTGSNNAHPEIKTDPSAIRGVRNVTFTDYYTNGYGGVNFKIKDDVGNEINLPFSIQIASPTSTPVSGRVTGDADHKPTTSEPGNLEVTYHTNNTSLQNHLCKLIGTYTPRPTTPALPSDKYAIVLVYGVNNSLTYTWYGGFSETQFYSTIAFENATMVDNDEVNVKLTLNTVVVPPFSAGFQYAYGFHVLFLDKDITTVNFKDFSSNTTIRTMTFDTAATTTYDFTCPVPGPEPRITNITFSGDVYYNSVMDRYEAEINDNVIVNVVGEAFNRLLYTRYNGDNASTVDAGNAAQLTFKYGTTGDKNMSFTPLYRPIPGTPKDGPTEYKTISIVNDFITPGVFYNYPFAALSPTAMTLNQPYFSEILIDYIDDYVNNSSLTPWYIRPQFVITETETDSSYNVKIPQDKRWVSVALINQSDIPDLSQSTNPNDALIVFEFQYFTFHIYNVAPVTQTDGSRGTYYRYSITKTANPPANKMFYLDINTKMRYQ